MDRKEFIRKGTETLVNQVTDQNRDILVRRGISDLLQNNFNKVILEKDYNGEFPSPEDLDLTAELSGKGGMTKDYLAKAIRDKGMELLISNPDKTSEVRKLLQVDTGMTKEELVEIYNTLK